MTWHDAETAPKKGGDYSDWGPVILGWNGSEMFTMHWVSRGKAPEDGYWIDAQDYEGRRHYPKHWHPLPPPPVAGDDK